MKEMSKRAAVAALAGVMAMGMLTGSPCPWSKKSLYL